MDAGARDLFVFGTVQPSTTPLRLRAGGLSAEFVNGSLRALRWHGLETVRGIDLLVRDKDWGSMRPADIDERHEADADAFRWERRFTLATGALECAFQVEGSASGRLRAVAEITARQPISTNRAGLTVLHPLSGVAGEPLAVRHPQGPENTRFPEFIAPSQPVFDVIGLRHAVGPVSVDITFEGEVFEMEDQRNWTDASFKTYCRPLAWPAPFTIAAGETIRQTVTVELSGQAPAARKAGDNGTWTTIGDSIGIMPQIMLAAEDGWLRDEDLSKRLSTNCISRLLLRVDAASADSLFARLVPIASTCHFDLEIVLSNDREDAKRQLECVAEATRRNNLLFDHVVAMPAAYLKSYQPNGKWPEGLTPHEAVSLVARAFPHASIGSGVLTNFTEFNRHRPELTAIDYVTYATTAIVHAADDRSVVETLEALPHIFGSTAHIVEDHPIRLGLVAIAMRSNPYGVGLADSSGDERIAMAGVDPRQRGLFAAAWAVGAVAATESFPIEAMALGAPAGSFALRDAKRLYPLHHVVRALARAEGYERLSVERLPSPLCGIAYRRQGRDSLLVANPRPMATAWSPPPALAMKSLVPDTAEAASVDCAWFDVPDETVPPRLQLPPYAVVTLTLKTDAR